MLASGKTITISITGGQAVMGLLGVSVWFASDPFVESLKNGMSQHQKQMFKEEMENYKSSEGRGGADNLTKEILREIAKMILEMYR